MIHKIYVGNICDKIRGKTFNPIYKNVVNNVKVDLLFRFMGNEFRNITNSLRRLPNGLQRILTK